MSQRGCVLLSLDKMPGNQRDSEGIILPWVRGLGAEQRGNIIFSLPSGRGGRMTSISQSSQTNLLSPSLPLLFAYSHRAIQ